MVQILDAAEVVALAQEQLGGEHALLNEPVLIELRRAQRSTEAAVRCWWGQRSGGLDALCIRSDPARAAHVWAASTKDAAQLASVVADDRSAATELIQIEGLAHQAESFAAPLAEARGGAITPGMRQQFHVLDGAERLVRPKPSSTPPGRLRTATTADLDVVINWSIAFQAEAFGPPDPGTAVDTAALIEHIEWKVSQGEIRLWCGPDGRPCTMVGVAQRIPGAARIHLVYTPPPDRGCGHATAATSAACTAAFDEGVTACTLFADVANPTSTGIYQRLGFAPAGEYLALNIT